MDRRTFLLREELQRLSQRVRGRNDAYWQWVLKDIELEAEPGDSVALIGPNGSGKSTLLKILTRVMYPDAGIAVTSGRIGALIEVRAGIHPELSGRENVYLYGSILGLTRKEITSRFDEIVAFAELEDAVDRQVKFYSSGMQMRLGFAVAAFLEPDVLIVDEVLAVGDASFQQKCLDRMRVILGQGTTLLFVSHDLAAVEATCKRTLWLDRGTVRADADTASVIQSYRAEVERGAERSNLIDSAVSVRDAVVTGARGGRVSSGDDLQIVLSFESDEPRRAGVHIGVSEGTANPIFTVRKEVDFQAGPVDVECVIRSLPLPAGVFYVWVGVHGRGGRHGRGAGMDFLPWHPVSSFVVLGPKLDPAPQAVARLAPVYVESAWNVGRELTRVLDPE